MCEASRLKRARAVSDLVVRELFGDDLARWDARHDRHVTWLRVAKHEHLGVSKTKLCDMVRVGVQARRFPRDLADDPRLTYTHRVILLPLPSIDDHLRLAKMCLAQRWSTRLLEKHVTEARDEQRPGKRRGRTRTPPHRKWLNGLSRAITAAPDEPGLDPAARLEVAARLDSEIARLHALRERLGRSGA